MFSSSVMHGVIRLSKFSGKTTSSSLNKVLNFPTKCFWISLLSVIHSPKSFFIESIEFLLLLMMVEKWKNFEFLSPSLSQTSLDFSFQSISFLRSHSFSSAWRWASFLQFSFVQSAFWISWILVSSTSILLWQWPNTSLFHLLKTVWVFSYFMYSFEKSETSTSFFQASSIIP